MKALLGIHLKKRDTVASVLCFTNESRALVCPYKSLLTVPRYSTLDKMSGYRRASPLAKKMFAAEGRNEQTLPCTTNKALVSEGRNTKSAVFDGLFSYKNNHPQHCLRPTIPRPCADSQKSLGGSDFLKRGRTNRVHDSRQT